MKQSKKLLSIFLAILMLIGSFSVVGNAALAKNEIAYDSIDNPALTHEQVAEVILDLLDNDIMPGLGVIEIPVLGNLNLSSIDSAFSSIVNLLGNWLLGLLAGGDAQTLIDNRTKLCVNGNKNDPYSRADGDLEVVYALLDFVGCDAVSSVLKKAPKGILTSDGINIGGLNGLVGGLVDLGSINDILTDIPGFLGKTVFDMLLYGSYPYQTWDTETQGLPAEANTLDAIVNTALKNFLTVPQDYDNIPVLDASGHKQYDAEGNLITTRVWDMDSVVINKSREATINSLDLTIGNNSIFGLVDKLLQFAYEDFGTVVLNHDVKKIFMEAMEVDFVEVTDAEEIKKIKADADYIDVEKDGVDVSSVKNFFCNAQMWEVDGVWYFRDYVRHEVGVDADGDPVVEPYHRYQRAEAYNANDLYYIFNWDYELTAQTLNFNAMLKPVSEGGYGSIIGCLNHIIHVIFEAAIDTTYLNSMGIVSIDQLWADGGNDKFNENLMATAKFLLKNFTFQFFGRNSQYVDLDTLQASDAFKAKIDSFGNDATGREGLIAYMLLPFLGDALPQLVYDLDMFTPGLQIEQVAALLVREFLSDLTPQVNYDDQIFVDATLKTGRTFQTKTSAQWFELILNMGLDLAAVYLDNISNFNVSLQTLQTIKGYAVSAGKPAWMGVLEEIVDWAVNYVGSGSISVLKGFEPDTLGAKRCVVSYNDKNDTVSLQNNFAGNAFTILSTALNNLLPLGLLCNVSSDAYALDVEKLFNRIIDVIDDLDLEVLLATFGRNGRADNILTSTNIGKQILNLVNKILACVFGRNLLAISDSNTLANILTDDNLGNTIKNLLMGLNERKRSILPAALPVVAVFVEDWGAEQGLRSPELSLESTTRADAGNLSYDLTISNGSRGWWRGYMQNGTRVQDEQYSYNVTSITSLQGVTIGAGGTGDLPFGSKKTIKLTGSVPTSGLSDRIDVSYTVKDEDGKLMNNGRAYTKSYYTYFSYDDSLIMNERHGSYLTQDQNADMPKYLYYAEEDLGSLSSNACFTYYYGGSLATRTGKVKPSGTTTQNGITLNAISTSAKASGSATAPFSFNPNNYTSVGHAGAAYTFSYDLDNNSKSESYTTTIFVYSGADFSQLADLVDHETSLARNPSSYKDQNAYTTYLIALADAMAIVYNPRVDGNFWTNAYDRYVTLEAAVEALEATEMTPEEQLAAGGDSIDAGVVTLEAQLEALQTSLNGKDYRTYMLYRWDRLKSARNDANYIVNLQKEVRAGVPTKKFTYIDISQAELEALAAKDAKYGNYVKALLVDLTEDELVAAEQSYVEKQEHYYSYTGIDVEQMSNLLTRMSGRLYPRDGGVVNTYLSKEIESAKAEIGSTNTKGYSTRSWDAYAEALSGAQTAMTSDSQDVIFAAKYALQVARNNLRLTTEEADYTELESLIEQAQWIFNNASMYKNTNVEFGKLLAAYGHEIDGVNLFPGTALDTNAKSYDEGDQEEVDDAAYELKKALARMEFKGASYNGDTTVGDKELITGRVDEDGNHITETVRTATISAKSLLESVVAKYKGSTATGAGSNEVMISFDDSYSVSDTNKNKFVGTGATITIYTKANGVTIPLSTIKVVVDGDVTGDGVIDVLDCMIIELAATDNTSLTGAYHAAGNLDLDAEQAITVEDLGAVANLAKAG
ncbi:MAG: hypothetical protein E7557_06105 [Ruminococcaceae bacterium]|nr:hypothetical protein [Oscillospiraceae bacterium]